VVHKVYKGCHLNLNSFGRGLDQFLCRWLSEGNVFEKYFEMVEGG
jgi:hypothetical protein